MYKFSPVHLRVNQKGRRIRWPSWGGSTLFAANGKITDGFLKHNKRARFFGSTANQNRTREKEEEDFDLADRNLFEKKRLTCSPRSGHSVRHDSAALHAAALARSNLYREREGHLRSCGVWTAHLIFKKRWKEKKKWGSWFTVIAWAPGHHGLESFYTHHILHTEQQGADWKTIFSHLLLLHSSSTLNTKIDGRLLPVEPDLLDCYGAFWHQHWLMRLKKPFLSFLFIYLFIGYFLWREAFLSNMLSYFIDMSARGS